MAHALFGPNSEFASGSGKGFEVRMFKRLRSILKKINYVKIEGRDINVSTYYDNEDDYGVTVLFQQKPH